jgi:glycosyltransferase involved in cell wall biosynthesis
MTAMTAAIVAALAERTDVDIHNWSRGKPLRGWRWRLARIWSAVKSVAGLLRDGRADGAILYYPVSSGSGMYYDLAIASVARRLGYRLVLHHHTYGHLQRRDWRAARLDRLVGSNGAHAVHCPLMRDDFLRLYPSQAHFLFVPPTIVNQGFKPAAPRPHATFTLGLLSALSNAKGLDDAIMSFARLLEQHCDLRLILAGPSVNQQAQNLIDNSLDRWPDRVEHRGAVYGDDKSRFYADIDAFIFPTRYESWGIVLCEALASGVPVVARSRGCVPWVVQGECGVLVTPEGDFVSAAVAAVQNWIADPAAHEAARAAARRRADELAAEADAQFPAFLENMLALGEGGTPTRQP